MPMETYLFTVQCKPTNYLLQDNINLEYLSVDVKGGIAPLAFSYVTYRIIHHDQTLSQFLKLGIIGYDITAVYQYIFQIE